MTDQNFDSTPEQFRKMNEKLMHPYSLKVNDSWRLARQASYAADIRAYWMMAKDVHKMSGDPETYGHEASKLLLAAHDIPATQLRHYLVAGRNLDDAFIDQVIAYNDSNDSRYGMLSPSHLRLLATMDDPKFRNKMFRAIKKEKLSVADMRARLKDIAEAELEAEQAAKEVAV